MALAHVDDVLVMSEKGKDAMLSIGNLCAIKEGSIVRLHRFLGATIEESQMPDGQMAWAMSPREHVKASIKIVEDSLAEDEQGHSLKSTAQNPFWNNCRPELDITTELDDAMASRCVQLIGMLRWAVELGRINIFLETSLLSQHQAMPREGHLEAVCHIFACLKQHVNGRRIAHDAKCVEIDESCFATDADWTDFCGDVQEEMPPKMPKARGNSVKISAFVDVDHASDKVT